MKQIDKLFDSIKDISKEKTKAYDTQATVTRVDGGTVYVHIPGGVDETPIDKTVSAKPGDVVQVRVANGKAWATGNATAPPTDDSAALRAEAEAARANQAASSATQSAQLASESAADAQQKATTASTAAANALTKAQEAEDSAEQAATAAATADQKATAAGTAAAAAQTSADQAASAAATADSKADAASAAATRAETKADTASAAASRAETSAANAQSSADSALVGLSTVQDVVGVLNWITAHGTMTSQSGGTFDADQVYFIQDNNGDYTVGGVRYSLVAEPKAADINSYYVLSVDESVQNYVATHIVVDGEGLWIIPDAGGNKVLIATGNGSSYTTAGTYIIGKVNNVDKVLAKFITSGATVGQTDGAHSVIDEDGQRFYASNGTTQLANIGYSEGRAQSGTAEAPYYTFGVRKSGSAVGNYSVAEGEGSSATAYCSHAEGEPTTASGVWSHAEGHGTTASGDASHAEGDNTTASGHASHAEGDNTTADAYASHAEGYNTTAREGISHAEGYNTTASGYTSHAEGYNTTASAMYSHAQNNNTIAAKINQTAIGKYNLEDTETTTSKQKALIIGNGTYYTRSNAFTVDWEGNTKAAGDITDGSGNVLSHKADSSSLATVAKTGSYNDLTNKPTLARVATSGSYNDLSNKPSLATVATTGSYNDLSNKPSLATVAKTGSYNDLTNKPSLPEIASGRTASITAAANNYKDLTVSFGRTFSSVPQVVCSIFSTSKAGAIGSLSCSALDVTTTGFKVRVFNAGSASRSPAVDWIAIKG